MNLIEELDTWIPDVDFVSALGIVHPQFWLEEEVEEPFGFHFYIIKEHLCQAKPIAKGGLSGEECQVIDATVLQGLAGKNNHLSR